VAGRPIRREGRADELFDGLVGQSRATTRPDEKALWWNIGNLSRFEEAMRRIHHTVLVSVLCAGALVLAGCSSSSNGKPSAGSTSRSSTSGFPSSSAPATTSSSADVTPDEVRSVLLTAADLSPTATSEPSKVTNNPLPCAAAGSQSLEQQVPSAARAGVDISDDTLQVGFSEEIRVFADSDTAGKALDVAEAGLNCKAGTLTADDGTRLPIALTAPTDIKSDLLSNSSISDVQITAAEGYSATSSDLDILLVIVQIDRSLLLMDFIAPTGADQSKLPDPEVIVAKAIAKGND
jgi:hypothetical protein